MPISLDFPEITDAFRRFLLLPVRPIAHSFEALSTWLEQRVKLADRLEQSSRRYPVIRFEADAAMLWLDPLQAGALASDGKPDSLATHVSRAGALFVRGLDRIATLIGQELILPNAFAAAAASLRDIAASVARFAGPPSSLPQLLFGHSGVPGGDPLQVRAADLWGEAALIWRTVAGSTAQLQSLVGPVGAALALLNQPATPAPGASTPIADTIENAGRFILAGLFLLPQLPGLLEALWRAVVIAVKNRTLIALAQIEARLNQVRKSIIDFFFSDLPGLLRSLLSYTFAANTVVIANLRFFTAFALGYGTAVMRALRRWFDAVASYLNRIIAIVDVVLDVVDRILQFDIFTVMPGLGFMPPLTLDDLITLDTEVARIGVNAIVPGALKVLTWGATGYLARKLLGKRLDAVPDLIENATRAQRSLPAETAGLIWPPGSAFPDLYQTIFAPGLAGFRAGIDELGRTTAHNARDIIDSGVAGISGLSEEFARQADDAAAMESTAAFRRLAVTADRQAAAVFGGDADRLRQGFAANSHDALGNAFEAWFAFGGFQALGEVIPAYARQLRELWQEKAAHGQEATMRLDMTSPRILAERAALAGINVKRVVIDASGKPVDRDLVGEVARQFKGAVQQAYLDGQKRLRQYATAVAV